MYVKEISKNFTDKKVTEILVENKQGLWGHSGTRSRPHWA